MGKARTMSRSRGHSGASADSHGGSRRGPSLTASERAYMIRKAKEASVALVDHAHTLDGPVQWHYTGKFRGIQMYRGEGSYDRVGTTGTEFLCGVTTMMGSIEEVASYFDQQTTERMLVRKADDVLDCGVLYSLVQGDPNNPFYRVSAKYQLYEGPSAFSRERDYCFLECQNTFRHASGRRGWVLSMHSIKLPNCPELDGVVRGSMYQSGYVFVEAEKEGYMDVMHSLQINFKSTSRLPHFLLNSALKRRILSVVTISREIQTSRMGRQTLLKKKDLMPKRARALCVNCSRKFSLFVRKTRCRVCGEVVCQPCAPQVMISTKRGPVKTRVCTKCYHLSPGDEYEPIGGLPNSQNGGDPRRMQNETRYSDILQDNPDVYHEADEDSMDEDEDEDGLEEQSDYSVFAQSRFTEASRDSVATSNFGASSLFESHFEGSSQFDATSELDDSQYYDGGASESSFVSGTTTSHWQGGNSTASSMMGWNQASSVKPAAGYIYDPQASMMSSGLYGTSKYGESEYGASNYTVDEEPDKRGGRHKAAAPIPEGEPDDYTISPNTSYNSSPSTNYNSAKGTNYNSSKASNSTQGTNYDASYASYNSNASHVSKTVSIQSLAKARSARYGIKSQFPPPPPPPPPLSPPSEEADEDGEDDSPLHLGALKSDNTQNSKYRKPKGVAARKMFTPPPPKGGRRENGSRTSVNRIPKVPQKEFRAASGSNDSRISQVSSRESTGLGSTRSSAILQQVRRNRNRTIQLTPDSDRSSAVLKTLEEEHLNRMREIERMQELAKEKAARRSMSSNGSRSSMQSVQSSQTGGRSTNSRASAAFAAAVKKTSQPRNAPLSPSGPPPVSPTGPPPGSPIGPPPGSPPGTPPSMRGRRMPSFNQQADKSFGDRSRRTDASSDFGGSRFLSTRSNGTFAKSNVRVSVAPSAQSEDLMFNSQRSGLMASKGSNASYRGRRLDASQASSKSSSSSFGSRGLNASQASSIRTSKHPDDLAFDASQLSVDKSKFSSSIAILETSADSAEHVVMMERLSSQRGSNASTLFDEDLLAQSSAGMNEHINSMRTRAAYQLPDEEDRVSDELLKREQEHRRRMEELTKMTANHVVEDNIRDSASSLGGLHDSSVSLNGFRNSSGNHFGDSSVSSASSVDIDDDEFDFESRPLGRTKRSGTIPFSLEELEQVPDADEDEEQSEGPDEPDTSFRLSEDLMDHEHESEPEDVKPSYRSSEKNVEREHNGSSTPNTAYRPSVESLDHKQSLYRSSEESVEHEHPSQPAYRTSEDSVELEHPSQTTYRANEESVEHEHPSQSSSRSSEESVEHEHPAYRSSEESVKHELPSQYASRSSEDSVEHEQPVYRSSEESVEHELQRESTSRSNEDAVGHDHPAYRSSEESVEHEHQSLPAYRSSEDSVEHEQPVYRSSVESVKHEHPSQSAYRSSEESMEHEHPSQPSEEHDYTGKNGQPDYRSSEESVQHEWAAYRSSEESVKLETAAPAYRPSEELESESDHAEPAYHSSDESEPDEADAANRSSEEPVAPEKGASNFQPSFQPGRSLHPIQREEDEETEMQWRSTDTMEEYQGRHQQDMERLRRKIRQLEEECRESIASVLTPEEMDLSEFDDDDEEPSSPSFNSAQSFNGAQSLNGAQSFNPQSSVVSTKGLSSSMPPQVDEPGSARALYDQIAKLTQLQREMAMAEDDDDEAEYRARIKEQYRLLRTIKVSGRR
ncbi:hypothetical protein KRP22_011889 [Phytophthora ramorum]|nr:1-phosphatidylinositol 3-phosphate 5-kinase [Phytophthora ramorum]